MKKTPSALAMLVLALFIGSDGHAQETPRDRIIEMARPLIDYDHLPGKEGKLIAGYDIKTNMPSQLKEFQIIEDEIGSWRHFLEFKNNDVKISMAILVMESASEAHFAAVSRYFIRQSSVEATLKRGDLRGIDIGDFNLINTGDWAVSEEHHHEFSFVRNNISIYLRRVDGKTSSLIAIARSIDAVLKAQPTYETFDSSGLMPVIEEFRLRDRADTVKEGNIYPLEVRVANPLLKEAAGEGKGNGEKKDETEMKPRRWDPSSNMVSANGVTTSKGLTLFFAYGAVMRKITPADTPAVSRVETTKLFLDAGQLRKQDGERSRGVSITMTAVNARLLAMKKTLELTITEAE